MSDSPVAQLGRLYDLDEARWLDDGGQNWPPHDDQEGDR